METTPYNPSLDWTHYLTRPFSLFGTSMWQEWYDSERIRELLGVSMSDALFIEEHQDVFRSYRVREQMDARYRATTRIVREESSRLESIFKRAFKLNDKAQEAIRKGPDAYEDFNAAIGAIAELTFHATVIPNLVLPVMEDLKVAEGAVCEMAEKLRGVSLYPDFNVQVVMPHVVRVLERAGAPAVYAPIVTLTELRLQNFAALEERMDARAAGKRFVYEILGAQENIIWIDDPFPLIREIEHLPTVGNGNDELRGAIAYRGKARGVARVVFQRDISKIRFDEGDILVSINSSPVFMPLIRKAAAIVTDEGGVACHAAIVSRELKKPCVIGTRFATSRIRDGMLVEVDAMQGIVRIL